MPFAISVRRVPGTSSRRIQKGRWRILINPTGTIDPHTLIFESNNVSSLIEEDRMRTVKVNFPGFVSFAVGREVEDFKKTEGELGR